MYGDPWCPLGYQYENGFCKQLTEICDQGYAGNYENGCDDIYNPDTDPLFNEYQKECVSRSSFAPPSVAVYDRLCCYDSVFNGYELFQWGREETYIKIY